MTTPPVLDGDDPATPAAVLEALLARPATLGASRLLAVDGLSGAGKTTLTRQVRARVRGRAPVVHLDAVYPGWDGLPEIGQALDALLRPLAAGEPGRYRRFDWRRMEPGPWVEIGPAPLVVVEGVGAGHRAIADLLTLLVWVEAPPGVRHDRGLARDGLATEPDLRRWWAAEERHAAEDDAAARAHLVVRTA